MNDILSQIIAYSPNKIDTETKARAMVQGPRNMYAGGQLVQNTVDGSRPGYSGKKLESGKKGVTIDGKQYRKITNPGHPKFGKISFQTSKAGKNITEYLTVEEVKNRVKSKKKIYTKNLDTMAEKNVKISQKLNKDINNWASNWFKNNQSKYAVRNFDKFSKAFGKAWKKELAANPDKYKGFMSSAKTIKFTSEGLPAIKEAITIDGIQFPQRQDASLAWEKLFYKNKLKDKNFKTKINKYLNWNLTKKLEGGAGSMTKTAALDYGKLAKGFDDDVVYFMGEVLNNTRLNPGGGQTGINDVFKKSVGKKADAYFKKYQGSWGRWTDNFYSVAKLAGLDQSQAKALLQKQINDTQKIMKVYNVKKLPLEFMVAQDHLFGLAEAKALGNPKIAAQTLKNLVASTKEQNRYLGQEGFSNKRVKLIKNFKAAPKNARGPIITELNALADEFVPGRLKYDVRKDGSLKITNLQPETTFKAKASAYEGITKNFPKNVQKAMLEFAGTITDKCDLTKTKADGGRIGFASGSADCLRIAKEGMDEGLTTGKWKSPEQAKMARNIAETAGKIGKTGIGARVMAELFGPVALASFPILEAGIAGYDTITSGTPFKEAVNKTLLSPLLGDKLKANPEKLQREAILKMSDGPEKEMLIRYFSNMGNLERVTDNYKKKAGLEQDKEQYETIDMSEYGDEGTSAAQAQKQIEAINKKILEDNAQGKDYMTLSRAVDDPYAKGLLESKQGELFGKRLANAPSNPLNPYYFSSNYSGEVDPKRIEEMKAKNIGMGDSQLYSRNQIVDFLKTVPDMEVTDETVDFLQTKLNADYFRNVLNQPGMLGTQYSEGGIASLNVNKK